MKQITFLILLFSVLLSSCGKYEEGPNISLRTKRARLSGTWKMNAEYVNGALISNNDKLFSIEFDKDNSFLLTEKSIQSGQTIMTNRGNYEFIKNKEFLRMNFYPVNSNTANLVVYYQEWEILKLYNDEFVINYSPSNSNDIVRAEFRKL
jgi:hypothetical protein